MKKKRLYVDMDGVLCNFRGAFDNYRKETPEQKYPQSKWGFFLKLEPIPGAIESFNLLDLNLRVRVILGTLKGGQPKVNPFYTGDPVGKAISASPSSEGPPRRASGASATPGSSGSKASR